MLAAWRLRFATRELQSARAAASHELIQRNHEPAPVNIA
jgi:hypothetical protein